MEKHTDLSSQAELLIRAEHRLEAERAQRHPPYLHVSEAISAAAFLYERVRNLVDFRAEHLVRKSAILRILKRRAQFLGQRVGLAENLVLELIRGRHLQNDSVPEKKVREVDAVLQKYLVLADSPPSGQSSDYQLAWILEMCAVEIEELFAPQYLEHATVQVFYDITKPHIISPDIDEETREFQLYIAAYRALRKSDPGMTEFHLLRLYVPEWFEKEITVDAAMWERLNKARQAMSIQLRHPIGKRFLAQMRKVVAPFLLIENFLREQGVQSDELLKNRDEFEIRLRKLIEEKYANNKKRLWRRGVRALIYVFLTKILIGLMFELPYDFFVLGTIHYLPLAINVLFPPVLLYLILTLIREPGKANTDLLVQAVAETVYRETKPVVFAGTKRLRLRRRSGFAYLLYAASYLGLFIFSYGAIAALLSRFNFNAVSTTLFLLFTSIISFFGVSLRQAAKEYIIIPGREGVIPALFNALTLPILTCGRWVSQNISRVNIFIFILDVLIEAPFQLLMEAAESWLDYLKEKKEEI